MFRLIIFEPLRKLYCQPVEITFKFQYFRQFFGIFSKARQLSQWVMIVVVTIWYARIIAHFAILGCWQQFKLESSYLILSRHRLTCIDWISCSKSKNYRLFRSSNSYLDSLQANWNSRVNSFACLAAVSFCDFLIWSGSGLQTLQCSRTWSHWVCRLALSDTVLSLSSTSK